MNYKSHKITGRNIYEFRSAKIPCECCYTNYAQYLVVGMKRCEYKNKGMLSFTHDNSEYYCTNCLEHNIGE